MEIDSGEDFGVSLCIVDNNPVKETINMEVKNVRMDW